MTDPTESPWTTHRFAITLAIHLFLGIMVSTRAWVLQEDRAFMALASLPMAQCSLIAIWAATSQAPDYVRFTLGVGAVFACWYELSTLIAWAGTGTTAMLWIVLLLYQTLFVLIGIASTRWMLRYVAAQAPRTEQFSFRIRTLNLWTAVVAITLTFFNFGRVNWQWDLGWMRSGVHVTVAIIALLNAVVACLWSSVWHSKSVTHGLVRGGVTFLLLIVFCWLADLVVTRWGVMIASDSLFHFLLVATIQSVILSVTFGGVGSTHLRQRPVELQTVGREQGGGGE